MATGLATSGSAASRSMRKPSSTLNVLAASRAGVGARLGSLPRTALGGATMRGSGSAARPRRAGDDVSRTTRRGLSRVRRQRVQVEQDRRAGFRWNAGCTGQLKEVARVNAMNNSKRKEILRRFLERQHI